MASDQVNYPLNVSLNRDIRHKALYVTAGCADGLDDIRQFIAGARYQRYRESGIGKRPCGLAPNPSASSGDHSHTTRRGRRSGSR
jgi:hypothetical protein